MPGKYLEYIRSGKYAIPVEISFLGSNYVEYDEKSGQIKTIYTSKWLDVEGWREIKTSLQPAITAVCKFIEEPNSNSLPNPDVIVAKLIILGYSILPNTNKSPFYACLDLQKNYWSDEEDNEDGKVISGIATKSLIPTKVYIKAIISSLNQQSDPSDISEQTKKVWKELGIKSDNARNYFTRNDTSNKTNYLINKDRENTSLYDITKSKSLTSSHYSSSLDLDSDRLSEDRTSPEADTDPVPLSEEHVWKPKQKSLETDPFWRNGDIQGSYYEEKDDQDDDAYPFSLKNLHTSNIHTRSPYSFMDNHNEADIEDEDDDFSLPDIDTPLSLLTKQKSRSKRRKGNKKSTDSHSSPRQKSSRRKSSEVDFNSDVERKRRRKKRDSSPINRQLNFSDDVIAGKRRSSMSPIERLSKMAKPLTSETTAPEGESDIDDDDDEEANFKKMEHILEQDHEHFRQTLQTHLHASSDSEKKSLIKKDKLPKNDSASEKSNKIENIEKSASSLGKLEKITNERVNLTIKDYQDKIETAASNKQNLDLLLKNKNVIDNTGDNANKESNNGSKTKTNESSIPSKIIRKTAISKKTKRIFNSKILNKLNLKKSQSNLDRIIKEVSHGTIIPKTEIDIDPDMPILIKIVDPPRPSKVPKIIPKLEAASPPLPKPKIKTKAAKKELPPLSVPHTNAASITSKKVPTPKHSPNESANNNNNNNSETEELSSHKSTVVEPESQIDTKEKMKLNSNDINIANEELASNLSENNNIEQEIFNNNIPATIKIEKPSPVPQEKISTSKSSFGKIKKIQSNKRLKSIIRKKPVQCEVSVQTDESPNPPPLTLENLTSSIDTNNEILINPPLGESNNSEESELEDFNREKNEIDKNNSQAIVSIDPTIGVDPQEDSLFSFEGINSLPRIKRQDSPTSSINRNNLMPPPTKRPPRTSTSNMSIFSNQTNPNPMPSTSNQALMPFNASNIEDTDDHQQQSLSTLSNYELLSNPNILKAGMGLLEELVGKGGDPKEIGKKLGFYKEKPKPVKRAMSPDICSISDRKKNLETKSNSDKRRHSSDSTHEEFSSVVNPIDFTENISKMNQNPINQEFKNEGGEDLLREWISRIGEPRSEFNPHLSSEYNPHLQSDFNPHLQSLHDDEFALSQRSECFVNIVPGYRQKSRLFKQHSKNAKELSYEDLTLYFNQIKEELKNIADGVTESTRHSLYFLGAKHRRALQDLTVSVPFTPTQATSLIVQLYAFLIPKVKERMMYTDYINYVMLPEAFIRIYSRLNDLSYEMAEKEMRFGALYDDFDSNREIMF